MKCCKTTLLITRIHPFQYLVPHLGVTNYPPSDHTNSLVCYCRISKGKSGLRGVYKRKKKSPKGEWEARLPGGGKGKTYTYLGIFMTEQEAALAHDKAAVEEHGAEVSLSGRQIFLVMSVG